MEVRVLLFGVFREIAGVRERAISIKEGSRLSDLLQQLSYVYGSTFQAEAENMRWLRILVNGREYSLLNGMETILKHQDEIVILPPIAGG